MSLNLVTGKVSFQHHTGEREISREALRDLAGRYGGVSQDDPEDVLLDHFAEIIDYPATRYPGVVITTIHLPL